MFARAKKFALASVTVGTALALAGCGIFVVDNAGGVGSCGSDPATVVTSQDAQGENLSITYTGPDTAGLMLVPGFYAEDSYLTWYFNSSMFAFAYGASNERDVIRLDPTNPGWTVTGSGANTTYSFSGSATELLNGAPTWWDTYPEGALIASILPLTVAVDCPGTLDTGSVLADDERTFTAAQPLYPNNLQLDPFEVVQSEVTPTGATAILRYAASAQSILGSLAGSAPDSFNIYVDNPDIPNDSIARLWSQAFVGGASAGSMEVTGTNPDGSFNVTISGVNVGDALADGSYLLFTAIANDDQTAAKIVFSSFTYSADNGLAFSNPFVPAPTLPDTGASAAQLWATGGIAAVLLALGAVAVLVTRRRRTTQQ